MKQIEGLRKIKKQLNLSNHTTNIREVKMKLYNEFINIAKTFNKELGIIPLLYGSLGLEKVTGLDFSPEDIDLLIPLIFLEEKWEKLKK